MTFQEILNDAYDDQGYQSFRSPQPPGNTPAADVVTRFKRWANEGVTDLLGRPRLGSLRHRSVPFRSSVGQTTYGLPDAFDAIDSIVQQSNDRRLRNMTRDWYRSIDPGERSDGTPYVWIDEGYAPVMVQPGTLFPDGTVFTTLWVVSHSALDTTQTAHIAGSISNGQLYGDLTVTLNGLTRVQAGAPQTWWTIESFFLDAPTVGNVEIWTAAVGGIRIAEIVTPRTSGQYHMVRLWPTPAAAELFLVDGQVKVIPLVEPNDVPFLIPRLYHQAIVDYVNYRAYEKNGDSARAGVCRANYERRIGELCNKMEFSADYRPVKGALGRDGDRWSNLGSWYPADGWGWGR